MQDWNRFGMTTCDSSGSIIRINADGGSHGIYSVSFTGTSRCDISISTSVAGTYYYAYQGKNDIYRSGVVTVGANQTIVSWTDNNHSADCRFGFVIKIS